MPGKYGMVVELLGKDPHRAVPMKKAQERKRYAKAGWDNVDSAFLNWGWGKAPIKR